MKGKYVCKPEYAKVYLYLFIIIMMMRMAHAAAAFFVVESSGD